MTPSFKSYVRTCKHCKNDFQSKRYFSEVCDKCKEKYRKKMTLRTLNLI